MSEDMMAAPTEPTPELLERSRKRLRLVEHLLCRSGLMEAGVTAPKTLAGVAPVREQEWAESLAVALMDLPEETVDDLLSSVSFKEVGDFDIRIHDRMNPATSENGAMELLRSACEAWGAGDPERTGPNGPRIGTVYVEEVNGLLTFRLVTRLGAPTEA